MDRVWDISKYPYVSCDLLPDERNERSKFRKKVKFNILSLGAAIMFLGQIFVKNAKNDQRTLFERPNSKSEIAI